MMSSKMSMKKLFQDCKNILLVLGFLKEADFLPVARVLWKREKVLIAGLPTEILIAVCCSHVPAQKTSLLIGNVTLISGNNVNISFIFSTIPTLMQNVSAKIIPLVISSLDFLIVSTMRIIIVQLSEEKR